VKILQLSGSPVAGVPWAVRDILRKHTSHECRILGGYHAYKDGRTWGKPDWSLADLRGAMEAVRWADVVVLHNGGKHPRVRSLPLKGKRLVAYYHSEPQMVDRYWEQRGVPTYVIAQGHSLLYPGMKMLPQLMDFRDPLLFPVAPYAAGEVVIGYAPSNTHDNPQFNRDFPYSSKGWPGTRDVLAKLFKEGTADCRIFKGIPWRECMVGRRACHIFIDECRTGSYHRSALEASCHGQLVVTGLNEAVRKIILEVTGAADVPWLRASVETLYDELRSVIADRRGLGERMASTRKWMDTYWQPAALLNRFWLPALEGAPMAR